MRAAAFQTLQGIWLPAFVMKPHGPNCPEVRASHRQFSMWISCPWLSPTRLQCRTPDDDADRAVFMEAALNPYPLALSIQASAELTYGWRDISEGVRTSVQESLLELGANHTARSDDAASQLKDLQITGTRASPLVATCAFAVSSSPLQMKMTTSPGNDVQLSAAASVYFCSLHHICRYWVQSRGCCMGISLHECGTTSVSAD